MVSATVEVMPSDLRPFWLFALRETAISGCVSFVTLYLIYRSGEPWKQFGFVRPGLLDVGLGLLLFWSADLLFPFMTGWLAPDSGLGARWRHFPRPEQPVEYALMILWCGVSDFGQELVTRAYLVTRFEQLLKSKAVAVLLSAVLFAAYHTYQGPIGVAGSLGMGIVYGIAFLCVRRIWPLAIGHALYNIVYFW